MPVSLLFFNFSSRRKIMEMAVAFGGKRLSYILKALTRDLPHMYVT